jgi:1-hydroxycarotenoid 3,4-desaturase
VVVGAGIGGLAAAIHLAARGVEVELVERAYGPGGKMLPAEVGDRRVDAGPTVFTMRWVLDELLDAAGTSLEAEVDLAPLALLARHAWEDGAQLDLHADASRTAEAIAAFAGPAEASGYLAFRARAERIYNALEKPFIRSERPTPLSLAWRAGPSGLGALMGISPFSTLWRELGRHFRDQRLRQLFGRYSTYCGASPFAAPGTLMLVAHVEQAGVWDVRGGMGALARALAGVAARLGARVRYGGHVDEVLVAGGRAAGVRLADGEEIRSDAVVLNADASALGMGLFGQAAARRAPIVAREERSLSAVTWALAAPARGFPMTRHNVFFSADYEAEFATLAAGRVPDEPTIYVCAEDRGDDAAGPGGPERLLFLINAPALGDTHPYPSEEIERCAETTFARLSRMGLEIERAGMPAVASSPADFARRFPATGGAIYGRASHGWRATFRRPGARTALPGLYLAGGSTHPGPGVPMAAMSGRLAASSLLSDWSSTARWVPTAMRGGTSTESATTVSTASR